jgi:hypothetical protein
VPACLLFRHFFSVARERRNCVTAVPALHSAAALLPRFLSI